MNFELDEQECSESSIILSIILISSQWLKFETLTRKKHHIMSNKITSKLTEMQHAFAVQSYLFWGSDKLRPTVIHSFSWFHH